MPRIMPLSMNVLPQSLPEPMYIAPHESINGSTTLRIIKNGNLSSQLYIEEIAQSLVTLIVIVPLFLFIATRKKLRIIKSHQIFLNLLFVHILFNISVIISNFVYYPRPQLICNYGLMIAMLVVLMVLTMERVAVIKFPFKYADVESKHIVIINLFSWLPTIMFVCSSFICEIQEDMLTITSAVLITVAITLLSLSNAIIYSVAKKHDQFLKTNAVHRQGNGNHSTKVLKASYVCFAIVFSFVIFWLPYLIHNLLAIVGVYKPSGEKTFTKVVEHIAFLNSLVDAVLFIWLSREPKKELARVFRNVFSRCEEHQNANARKAMLKNAGRYTDNAVV